MSKINPNPARGMRDLLPVDVERREYIASIIIETYQRYGFQKIETPFVERIELLTSGEGGENEQLIFKIMKRGEKLKVDPLNVDQLVDLGLRYDLTVPLVRFYANHRAQLPYPFRSIQIGSVWRADRPQKGRYRQFHQCDIDIIGDSSILSEIQLIVAASEAFRAL